MLNYDEIIKNINILLADDDEDYLVMTSAFLKQKGFNISKVNDGKKALEELKTGKYQIALLDYFMPELNGEEVVSEIRKENKEIIIILQTGFSGQKPPVDTLKSLDIQNYFDKTEGVDRLNMQLISSVKVYAQQNEIKIAEYKASAMGRLVSGIAQEIKMQLMNVGAGNEVTNMTLNEISGANIDSTTLKKLDDIYLNSRQILDQIDKALSSIISQNEISDDYVMTDDEILYIINLIVQNDVKLSSVDFDINLSLKTKSYIAGNINNTLYIICEILKKLMYIDSESKSLEFIMAEDEENWIFEIKSERIKNLTNSDIFVYKNVFLSLGNKLLVQDNKICIYVRK